jgi:integration host factor subunit alpha
MTRADLVESINRSVGLPRAEASRMVESILGHISDALVSGEMVKLTGFGTFTLRDKKARVGRNPKTGVEATITPRRVLGFRPSQTLRQKIADKK